MNESPKQRLQRKREAVILLREQDRRLEKDPDEMLESELDKEIEWRKNPRKFDTSSSVLNMIDETLKRLEKKVALPDYEYKALDSSSSLSK